jgi:hypothetical protein
VCNPIVSLDVVQVGRDGTCHASVSANNPPFSLGKL